MLEAALAPARSAYSNLFKKDLIGASLKESWLPLWMRMRLVQAGVR